MTDEIINLAPPLTAEQLKANEKFQQEMRERFALPATARNDDAYRRRYIADTLDILRILQHQFETESDHLQRAALSAKSRRMKIDCCQWMVSIGLFNEAISLCPDEATAEVYRKYLDAENRHDAEWCEHPRYIEGSNGKPQPNYFREFDYFSATRGKMISMTKCAMCEMRNAVDVPKDLLDLDRQREIKINDYKARQSS